MSLKQVKIFVVFVLFSLLTSSQLAVNVERIAFGSCFHLSGSAFFQFLEIFLTPKNKCIENLPNYSVQYDASAIWTSIQSFHPNRLVLLGDQVYADRNPRAGSNVDISIIQLCHCKYSFRRNHNSFHQVASFIKTVRKRYEAFSSNPNWMSLVNSLHGWMATFDDHDFGGNNANMNFPFRNESQALFRAFAQTTDTGFALLFQILLK